jgi:digeranylgeranylglycerophospholipid reductase
MNDAVIIGASIGGLYAGMKLARHGCSVCILDRRKTIGLPVRCGELTGNRHELSRFITIDESWIARDISGLAVHHDGNLAVKITAKDFGLILNRDRFEQSLAAQAVRYGATIHLNTRVAGLLWENGICKGVVDGNGNRFGGALIIGADGCESMVGRWAGITGHVRIHDAYSSVQYRVTSQFCNDTYAHFFVGQNHIPRGYIWVFPKSGNEISVGAGLYHPGKNGLKAIDYLDQFMKQFLPEVSGRDCITGCVPLSVCPRSFVKNNILVVGDAARIVNPLSAGGIMNTLEATDIAVRVILKYGICSIDAKNLNEYSSLWINSQRKQQKAFYIAKEIFIRLTDTEIVSAIHTINRVFGDRIDRTKPFNLPLLAVLRLFLLFFIKTLRCWKMIVRVMRM